MNRLKKELSNRGIIGNNEEQVLSGKTNIEYFSKFIDIQNGYIITAYCSNVLDPMFILYDRNLKKVAEQCIWLDNMTHNNTDGQKNPWDTYFF